MEPGIWLPRVVDTWNYHVSAEGQDFLVSKEHFETNDWKVNEDIDESRFAPDFSSEMVTSTRGADPSSSLEDARSSEVDEEPTEANDPNADPRADPVVTTATEPVSPGVDPTVSPRRVPVLADPYRIAAGDVLSVSAAGTHADAPIADDFVVEPSGSVALGPVYGRVKVAGMSLEEAEKAIEAHLRQQLADPKVQVTVGGWRGRANVLAPVTPSVPGKGQALQGGPPASVDGGSIPGELPPGISGADAPGSLPRYVEELQPQEGPATPEALQAMREHVQFLEDHFKKVEALNRNGMAGGEAHSLALAGYELAVARGELALTERNRDEARTRFEEAEKDAEEALVAAQAAHRAAHIDDDALLRAAKNLAEIKRRLSIVRHSVRSGEDGASDASASRETDWHERMQVISTSSGAESLGVLEKIAERAKGDFDRVKRLAERKVVSATELARAKSDYEIAVERLRQAERGLRYYRLLVEAAEADYQSLLEEKSRTPNSVTNGELRKAKIAVELAKAKLDELSE
jgi:hypothetical protein